MFSRLLPTILAAGLCTAGISRTAIVMDFDATNWSGSGAWNSSVGGEQLTIGVGAPTRATDTTSFPGQSLHYTSYAGNSGFVSDASSLMAGLKEFTISAVIRVGSTPGLGGGAVGSGWNYNPITAFEIGGGNQGEFQFGFPSSNQLSGAVGLNGDNAINGSAVTANVWTTVAFVVNQDPNNNNPNVYNMSIYTNGTLSAVSGLINYGASPGDAIRNSPFGVGFNVISNGDRRFLTGDIAHIRYDNSALTPAQLGADAANFLGTIPEPSTGLLALAGLALAGMRRKR